MKIQIDIRWRKSESIQLIKEHSRPTWTAEILEQDLWLDLWTIEEHAPKHEPVTKITRIRNITLKIRSTNLMMRKTHDHLIAHQRTF